MYMSNAIVYYELCAALRHLPAFPTRRSSDLTWITHDLRYKPGDAQRPPPLIAPHQPRLDFQLWFYGLGHTRGIPPYVRGDRKSTRLNSSHSQISYAVFCSKKTSQAEHEGSFC